VKTGAGLQVPRLERVTLQQRMSEIFTKIYVDFQVLPKPRTNTLARTGIAIV
jgi:hypothetical protein